MKAELALAAAAAVLLVLCPARAVADVADPGGPHYTNRILGGFVTPVVRPGETIDFSFNVSNPYGDGQTMSNVTLVVGIYRYATEEGMVNVTDSFKNPPLIHGVSTTWYEYIGILRANETVRLELPIETRRDTPHGSCFSQSTYFVRFKMTFTLPGNDTKVVLWSPGWFTDEQWEHVVSFEGSTSIVNRTYMKALGVDGLLPDSSFGIKLPIPHWPLGAIIAACVALSGAALYFHVLDNPGRYPRLEKRFYQLRGELRELRGKLEHRRRK